MSEIFREFKQRRIQLGVTQKDLAGAADVSPSVIAQYEAENMSTPKKTLQMETYIKLRDALDRLEREASREQGQEPGGQKESAA